MCAWLKTGRLSNEALELSVAADVISAAGCSSSLVLGRTGLLHLPLSQIGGWKTELTCSVYTHVSACPMDSERVLVPASMAIPGIALTS